MVELLGHPALVNPKLEEVRRQAEVATRATIMTVSSAS